MRLLISLTIQTGLFLTNNTAMSPTAIPTNSGGAIPSGAIDSNGNVGEYTSIAIDSNGFKHISYYDDNGYLNYATDRTGSWVTISVATALPSYANGYYTSIAVDSNDTVHISYYKFAAGLKYATCSNGCTNASNWDIVSINIGSHRVGGTSIAIDSNYGVHISVYDEINEDLDYATCSSNCTSASNWDVISVDTTGHVGEYSSNRY